MKKVYVIAVVILTALNVMIAAKVMTNFSKGLNQPKYPATDKAQKLGPVIRLVKEGRTYCSGVVIDATTIVTASHCVVSQSMFAMEVDRTPIEIRASDNHARGTTAQVKDVLMQMDRAVLKGDFSIFAPAKYVSDVEANTANRKEGALWAACGYPLGGKLFCTQLVFRQNAGFMLGVSGVLIPGMSGGPTFNANGEVVAINVAVDGDLAFVSPIYNVEDEK